LAKELIQEDADKFIRALEGILTVAVRNVFFDVENPRVVIDIKEGMRNSAQFYYCYEDGDQTIKSNITKAVGGGVKCVVGFVLQVFFLSYYKKHRVIFADEAFKELSKQYRPYFIEFLKDLCKKSGYIILMVTHDSDIVDSADKVYEMSEGVLQLRGVEV